MRWGRLQVGRFTPFEPLSAHVLAAKFRAGGEAAGNLAEFVRISGWMDSLARPRVRVYGTSYCGYCRRAEDLLESRGIPYEAVDVTGDREVRAWLVENADGRRTVPVIFIDGRPIGGYQELARLSALGSLDHLTGDARAV